ncbi:MAG TPA: glycoside hydrolase family 19 protein [Luteimonas sp.]|nr:glycoside hydrolase family 19 protein [Luteimonas sp.]HRO28551.1 glycoside hydrolase family 19 protein [Luteimonas sp.]HRP72977.1 glycoside hydrolase family 19 protein [Luteimonas sp.]
MSRINRDFFFQQVRGVLFEGRLRQGQVEGLSTILDYWGAKLATRDDRWLAYALATTHHETDRKMQPILEYGSNAYKRRMYDVAGSNPSRAARNGNTSEGDGVRYAGRGYVQLTWKNNYRRAGQAIGRDLVDAPDDAMLPEVAVEIMFRGMVAGWFTGRRLADYFTPTTGDWRNARRIINGLDKADLINGHAQKYYSALSYTT